MYRSVTYIPSSLSLKMYEAWIGTQAYMIMLFTKISFLHVAKSCCRNTESSSSSAPNQTCFAAIDVTPVCGVTLFPSGKQRKRVNAVELSSEFTIIFQLYTLTGYANDSER